MELISCFLYQQSVPCAQVLPIQVGWVRTLVSVKAVNYKFMKLRFFSLSTVSSTCAAAGT